MTSRGKPTGVAVGRLTRWIAGAVPPMVIWSPYSPTEVRDRIRGGVYSPGQSEPWYWGPWYLVSRPEGQQLRLQARRSARDYVNGRTLMEAVPSGLGSEVTLTSRYGAAAALYLAGAFALALVDGLINLLLVFAHPRAFGLGPQIAGAAFVALFGLGAVFLRAHDRRGLGFLYERVIELVGGSPDGIGA